jgi:citrate lyase subunit beta/citryl-CoA lyase
MVTSHMLASLVAPLFVPADRPDRFAKAAASGADAVILDLEDAVAPAAKEAARNNLSQAANLARPLIVRVNARATPWHEADVLAVRRLGGAALMLPKTESAEDIGAVSALLGGATPVVALIESACGIAQARAIAGAAARLAFGSIDYCADLGCAHTDQALLSARCEIAFASRLAGLPQPIAGVTKEIGAPEILRRETAHARELGFGGKLCIHPSQIAVVIEGFAPSEEEIGWASRILAVAGDGAASVDGIMVDAPVRLMAERLLARARARQAAS